MRRTEFLESRRATEEDVLRLLQEDLDRRAEVDPEVDAGYRLTPETSIARWRSACDLVADWTGLASLLNGILGVSLAAEEYRRVLQPERRRTLARLCELVLPQMRVPVVAPFGIGGTTCLSAGAFLILRTLLVQAGLPFREASPSAAVTFASWDDVWTFERVVTRLAPGLLPSAQAAPQSGIAATIRWLFLAGLMGVFVSLVLSSAVLLSVSFTAAVVGLVGGLLLGPRKPAEVPFEGLETLGDVARAVASRAPASRPTPGQGGSGPDFQGDTTSRYAP